MPSRADILLIDDDRDLREQLARNLTRLGYQIWSADNVNAGFEILSKQDIACAVVDHYMPDLTGMDFLKQMEQQGHDCAVVMMSGQGTITMAVEAMKCGAVDFLQKPVRLAELQTVLERQIHHTD